MPLHRASSTFTNFQCTYHAKVSQMLNKSDKASFFPCRMLYEKGMQIPVISQMMTSLMMSSMTIAHPNLILPWQKGDRRMKMKCNFFVKIHKWINSL